MTVLTEYPRFDEWPLVSTTGKLHQLGVPATAISEPEPIRRVHGFRGSDGRFELDDSLPEWLAFPEEQDVVFWEPRTGELATWNGKAFALGEAVIGRPSTYAMGYSLNIFNDPLAWLRGNRDGIVVLKWTFAFDHLREAPRIAVAPGLIKKFKSHMKPRRMPAVSVLQGTGA